MKKFELVNSKQFKNCHATVTTYKLQDGSRIELFTSYTTPVLVNIEWYWMQFKFDNSRKTGCKTTSRSTSKQKTQYFGYNGWKNLPYIQLNEFENEYFSTVLDKYY